MSFIMSISLIRLECTSIKFC